MSIDFEPQKSVEWYDPGQLAGTGIKAVISSIFGNFNDKREIQAALYQEQDIKSHDYSQHHDLWIDYIADLGDGFDATFTMASLLAREEIQLEGEALKRGQILIMGGDQVYPTASREEYNNRLKGPYKYALPYKDDDPSAPHLFAIPGNHDWYDGLSNFIKIFCQKRAIGNWRTKQTRSYFAIKLPHNLWIFGIDVQLNSDVDYNQIQYFRKIIANEVMADSKVIVCTAEPTWVYSTSTKSDANKNLEFFEKQIIGDDENGNKSKLSQIITIAGDFHHYSRYQNDNGAMKFTSGGGGAFMHPTQNLPSEIGGIFGGDLSLKSRFPSASDSKKLLFQNFKFPFTNYKMALLLGCVYALISWLLFVSFGDNLHVNLGLLPVLKQVLFKPGIFLLLILVIMGLTLFAETTPCNPRFKSTLPYTLTGFIHGIGQVKLVLFSFYLLLHFNPLMDPPHMLGALLFVVGGSFVSGFLLGGILFGLYLIFSNLVLGNHDNEAYSSLKWEGYKNFLRFHITSDSITIYPIGVPKVSRWKVGKNENRPFETNKPPACQLIEKPITINIAH